MTPEAAEQQARDVIGGVILDVITKGLHGAEALLFLRGALARTNAAIDSIRHAYQQQRKTP